MKTRKTLILISIFFCLISIYGQTFDLTTLEKQNKYTNKEIRFVLGYIDMKLSNNIEKSEVINNLTHRILFYETKKFLNALKRIKVENIVLLLEIIENPLNDKYDKDETIKKIEKINYNNNLKTKLLDSIKKI